VSDNPDNASEVHVEPMFIKSSSDENLPTLHIGRDGGYEDLPRSEYIEVQAEVALVFDKSGWTFRGEGFGMWRQQGIAGQSTVVITRDISYNVVGELLPPPLCYILIDSLIETSYPGELCVSHPLIGTICEPEPEDLNEDWIFEFPPMIIPFIDNDDVIWTFSNDWKAANAEWYDLFWIDDWGDLTRRGCVPPTPKMDD